MFHTLDKSQEKPLSQCDNIRQRGVEMMIEYTYDFHKIFD